MEKERKGRRRGCPNASNPYHDCARSCTTTTTTNHHHHHHHHPASKFKPKSNGNGNGDGDEKRKIEIEQCVVVDPTSLSLLNAASIPTAALAPESPVEMAVPQIEQQAAKRTREERRRIVDPNCSNASNPYHECTPHCSTKARGRPSRSVPVVTADGTTRVRASERTHVHHRKCANASNPYHNCTQHCSQKINGAI